MSTDHDPAELVLWSDDALLVVNKPAGLLVIRGGHDDSPYLTQVLEPLYGRLWVVHRLDRQTSGVVVLARSAEGHRVLNTQFQEHLVAKIYHALVTGDPVWAERAVDLPLRRDGDRRHRTVVDTERGRPSLTRLRILERFGTCALLEAAPQTGRTHQIRAHLAAAGHPIVADGLYGAGPLAALSPAQNRSQAALIDRTALHALRLTIAHPVTGQQMPFEAPYPEDLASALQQLRAG